jgi:protoheme IX farnesyltransferase
VAGVLGTALLTLLGTVAGVVLGIASLVVYAGVYTPMKRVSPLALLVGALPGAAPPLIAAAALGPEALPAGLGLFLLLFLWQIPHFGGIVVRRADEYRAAGLRIAPPREQLAEAVRGVRIVAAALVVAPALVAPMLGWTPLVVVGLGVAALPQAIASFASSELAEAWGKRVFLGSLPYLPLVAVTIAVDAMLGVWLRG